MKYIVMDNCGIYRDDLGFYIFSDAESHDTVASCMGGREHVVSAGFIRLQKREEDNTPQAVCYGTSVSLEKQSRPDEDSRMISNTWEG